MTQIFWDLCSSAVVVILRFWIEEHKCSPGKAWVETVCLDCSKEEKQQTEEMVAREPETQQQYGLVEV